MDENDNSFVDNDGWTNTLTMDSFGRVTNKATAPVSGNAFTSAYTYLDDNADNSTTELIEDIAVKYGDTDVITYTYEYDANGKPLTTSATSAYTSIATINPLRYRGYVYDKETGFYYLQSRYYDPVTCRFVNGDPDYISTGQDFNGYNMHTYCSNNPISYSDYTGTRYIASESVISEDKDDRTDSCILQKEISLTVFYDVPIYCQYDSNLCWAFCQTMIEDYKTGIIKTQSEACDFAINIAIDYHKANGINDKARWNRGGWPRTNGSRIYSNGIYQLYYLLKNNGPVYAYYCGNSGSHLVVVTGVNLYKNYVYTNNPWFETGTTQSYEEHLQGVDGVPTNYNMPLNYYYIPW